LRLLFGREVGKPFHDVGLEELAREPADGEMVVLRKVLVVGLELEAQGDARQVRFAGGVDADGWTQVEDANVTHLLYRRGLDGIVAMGLVQFRAVVLVNAEIGGEFSLEEPSQSASESLEL